MGYQVSEAWRLKYHAYDCPTCHAKPGQPCMTKSGYITLGHRTRPINDQR